MLIRPASTAGTAALIWIWLGLAILNSSVPADTKAPSWEEMAVTRPLIGLVTIRKRPSPEMPAADAAVDAGADAVLAASVFHFKELSIGEVKAAMAAEGIVVR